MRRLCNRVTNCLSACVRVYACAHIDLWCLTWRRKRKEGRKSGTQHLSVCVLQSSACYRLFYRCFLTSACGFDLMLSPSLYLSFISAHAFLYPGDTHTTWMLAHSAVLTVCDRVIDPWHLHAHTHSNSPTHNSATRRRFSTLLDLCESHLNRRIQTFISVALHIVVK